MKLYEMVENESDEIISWVSNGNAFKVLNPKKLEEEVLPKFFRHGCFQSFVRQLNFYSFRKTIKDRSVWIYAHDCFVAGRPELLEQVKRKTNRGIQKRRGNLSSLDSSYNFKAKGGLPQSAARANDLTTTRKRAYSDSQCDYYFCSRDSNKENGTGSTMLSSLPVTRCSPSSGSDVHSRSTPEGDNNKKKRQCLRLDNNNEKCSNEGNSHCETIADWRAAHNYFIDEKIEHCPNSSVTASTSSFQQQPLISTLFNPVSIPWSRDNEGSALLTAPCYEHTGRGECEGVRNNCDELVLFCLKKDPWQSGGDLYADILNLLTRNKHLESEMALYCTALSPRAIDNGECRLDHSRGDSGGAVSPPCVAAPTLLFPCLSPRRSNAKQNKHCELQLVTRESGEISTVRMFISFALSCLHIAQANDNEDRHLALQECASRWGSYAQFCM